MRRFASIRLLVLWTLFWVAMGTDVRTSVAQEPKPEPQSKIDGSDIEGKWERFMTSNGMKYRIVKEHRDHATAVLVYDSTGKLLQEKHSRYEIDTSGSVRVFTYFDNKVVAGQNRGAFLADENSYVYRVDGDRFYEIHGIRIRDDQKVQIIVWKRVAE